MERELRLRAHIRTHLLEYCLTHITTNYVTFTEYAVGTLLSQSLAPVPIVDPNFLTLPTDPLDTFLESTLLTSVAVDEKWTTDVDVIKHIRNAVNITDAKSMPTERCWDKEGDSDWEHFRPMSPLLTTRAIRETPKFGFLSKKATPKSLKGVIETFCFGPISVADIPDPPIPSLEDALNIKYTVDPTTHLEIVNLLKTIPAYSATTRAYSNPHVNHFLGDMSPPMRFVDLDTLPIFSRTRRFGFSDSSSKASARGCNRISDLPNFLLEVEVEEEDTDVEHMIVVDGWQAYAPISSPSPTPSLRDGGTSSQLDELLLLSPDTNDNYALDFELARMDDVQISRTERFGQGSKKPRLSEAECYSKFLTSRLPLSAQLLSESQVIQTRKSHHSLPCEGSSEIGFSMLGQPPSATLIQEADQEEDSDPCVSKVWKSVMHEDFADIILQDGLDTKDGLLMEVPDLPPPTAHSVDIHSYQSLRAFVSPPSTPSKTDESIKHAKTLKQVKGIKPLNLELSWVPFKFGKKIPTNEEVARVSKTPLEDPALEVDNIQRRQIDDILDRASADCTYTPDDADHDFKDAVQGQEDRFIYGLLADDEMHAIDFVFTREERYNLAAAEAGHQDELEYSHHSADHAPEDSRTDQVGKRDYFAETNEDDRHIESGTQVDYCSFDDAFLDYQDYNNNCGFGSTINAGYKERLEENMNVMQPPAKRVKLTESLDNSWFPVTGNDGILEQELYDDSGIGFAHDQNTPNDNFSATTRRFTTETTDELPLHYIEDDSPMFDFADSQRDADGFYPLSFDSTQPTRALLSDSYTQPPGGHFLEKGSDDTMKDQNDVPLPESNANDVIEVQEHLLDCSIAEKGPLVLGSTRNDFADFLKLRGKDSITAKTGTEAPLPVDPVVTGTISLPYTIPEDIFDRNTLRHTRSLLSSHSHRYLASFNLIQKRALVRSLSNSGCAIDLIERDALDGVDLILDPETAINFISLMTVPSECDSLSARLSTLSWRFKHLLIVFECFPAGRSYANVQEAENMPFFAFSHPVVKAIKKLRRGLGIAEGSGTKRVGCEVSWAFAMDVAEAARFSREFGDVAEGRDKTGGVIWGTREWLIKSEEEGFEGEEDLASVEGLNTFVACVILSQVTLEEFLDMTPVAKIDRFGHVLGTDRMVQINEVLLRRHCALQSSSPLPASL